jgi:hypothetical protein
VADDSPIEIFSKIANKRRRLLRLKEELAGEGLLP